MGLGKVLKKALPTIATGGHKILYDKLKPKKTTQSQVPLETSEQAAARQRLLKFSETGEYGAFKAGTPYGGPLGDFSMSEAERIGQSKLANFVAGGRPEIFDAGAGTLREFLSTDRFDPLAPGGEYAPFKAQVERELQDATTATKRDLAYQGKLYSSEAGKRIGDVQARGQEQLSSKLAELSDKFVQRKLSAIPLAFDAANQEQALNLIPIEASQQYGGLSRQLGDAAAKSKLAEFIRQRQELLLPLNALNSVAGQNAQFGIPEVTSYQPSTAMELLHIGADVFGKIAGGR